MANSKLFQVSQVHCLHKELIDHPLLKFVLVVLTSRQINDPCVC